MLRAAYSPPQYCGPAYCFLDGDPTLYSSLDSLVALDALKSVLEPIETATGIPNVAYTDARFFELERDELIARTWACIGFASDLVQRGSVKPVTLMGFPLVMMRSRHDQVRVFHNVCSHRGMRLVREEAAVRGLIRCPYHSWTYDLDGNLKGTPHIGGVGTHQLDRFDCEKNGLKPVRSHVWMDMVFVNLEGQASDFDEHVEPLLSRWQTFLGESDLALMRRANMGGNLEIQVAANWKLAVENYCESYHLPWVHPSLNAYSRLEDHYHIVITERFAGQGSLAYNLSDVAGTYLPKFPNWPKDKHRQAEYIAMFPNVLLGVQADHVFAMMLQPLAPDRTMEHLRIYYVGDEAIQDSYAACRTATLESWRVVFGEDVTAVEGLQLGRQSPGYGGGVFSPVMDEPTHHFHAWVAKSLLDRAG